MLTRLKNLVVHNILLKVTALSLALIVYLTVYLDDDHQARVRIPFVIAGVPAGRVVLDEIPTHITVEVEARGQLILEMRLSGRVRNELYAVIEIDEGTERIDRPLTTSDVVVPLDLGVRVVDVVEPERLTFRLDDLVERTLTIVPRVEGELPRGHVLGGEISVTPDEAVVSGPKALVESLEGLETEPFDLSGKSHPFREGVALAINSRLTVSPARVQISADIERTDQLRVEQVPVVVRNLRRYGYTIDPGTGAVTLLGPRSQLERIRELTEQGRPTGVTVVFDAQGLTPGAHTVTPTVELAGQLRLVAVEPEQFQLTIKVPTSGG